MNIKKTIFVDYTEDEVLEALIEYTKHKNEKLYEHMKNNYCSLDVESENINITVDGIYEEEGAEEKEESRKFKEKLSHSW